MPRTGYPHIRDRDTKGSEYIVNDMVLRSGRDQCGQLLTYSSRGQWEPLRCCPAARRAPFPASTGAAAQPDSRPSMHPLCLDGGCPFVDKS